METIEFAAEPGGGLAYSSSSTGRHSEQLLAFCQYSGEKLLTDEQLALVRRYHPQAYEFCLSSFRYATEAHKLVARGDCYCCQRVAESSGFL